MAEFIRTLHPLFFDDDDGSGSGGGSGAGDGDGGSDDGSDGAGSGSGASGGNEPDWKAEARKHERRWKEREKRLTDLEKQLKERDDATKSEHEKALEKAREEAAAAARQEAAADVRTDRLEAAVARLAAGRFADVDDALLRVQAAIRKGDLAEDDVFDADNRVQSTAIKVWLDQLLAEKKHLASGAGAVQGDGDGGKGASGGGKGLEDMSVDDHFAAIRRTK